MRFFAGAASVAAALALASSVATAQSAAMPKIGYVNGRDILEAAPGRAEAEAQFQKELQGYQQQIQRMGDSLNVLIADYNKQEASLSPVAKENKQKSIRAREQEYQGRQQSMQQQMQQREQQLVQPVIDQVKTVIDAVRAEGSYSMIFDVTAGEAQGIAFLVSYDKNLDVTQQVISRLRAAGPRPTASGAPLASPSGVGARPKTP